METTAPTFTIRPWHVIVAIILLVMIIGGLYNRFSPEPCERDWRDYGATSQVGHDEYIRNCREARKILGD